MKRNFLAQIMILFLVVTPTQMSWGEVPSPSVASPLPAESVTQGVTEEEVLKQLPSFDLQVVPSSPEESKGSAGLLVGDTIRLKVFSNDLSWTEIDTRSSGNLTEQGWEVGIEKAKGNEPGQTIVAIPLKPGRLILPMIILKDSSGKAVGRSNPFSFDVGSAIQKSDPKPDKPEDIEPPLSLKFPYWMVFALVCLAVAAFAGIVFGVYYWLRKRTPKKKVLSEVSRSDDEVALSALSELEKQGFLNRNEFKKYYFGISEILKIYLGARYEFDAPESTSIEILKHLENRKIQTDRFIDRLEVLFEKLDRVKFTDFVPDREEPIHLMGEARKLISETRRLPTVLASTPTGTDHGVTGELGNASR